MNNIGNATYYNPGIGRAAFCAYIPYGTQWHGRFDLPVEVTRTYMRGYFMFGAGATVATNAAIMQCRTNTGASPEAGVALQTSRHFALREATSAEATSSLFVEPFTVYRLELTAINDGLLQLKIFCGDTLNNPADGTATETLNSTLNGPRDWDGIQFGSVATTAPVGFWMADVAFSTNEMPAALTYNLNSVAWAA